MRKCLFIFAAMGLGFVSQAGSVSYTNNIPETLTDWTNTVALTQFNPTLGVLASVQISVQSDLDTTLTVQNVSPSSSSGSAITQLKQYLQTGSFGFFANSPVLDYASPEFDYTLPSNGKLVSDNLQSSFVATSPALMDDSTLTAFTGTGLVDFTTYTSTRSFLSNSGGNTGAKQVTSSDLQAVVIYSFNPYPVPEPSVVALGGFGLAALAFVRRPRK